MLQQQLGVMQIARIIEYQSSEYVRTSFFPQASPDDGAPHEQWMKSHAMDQETGNLTLVMQFSCPRKGDEPLTAAWWPL